MRVNIWQKFILYILQQHYQLYILDQHFDHDPTYPKSCLLLTGLTRLGVTLEMLPKSTLPITTAFIRTNTETKPKRSNSKYHRWKSHIMDVKKLMYKSTHSLILETSTSDMLFCIVYSCRLLAPNRKQLYSAQACTKTCTTGDKIWSTKLVRHMSNNNLC